LIEHPACLNTGFFAAGDDLVALGFVLGFVVFKLADRCTDRAGRLAVCSREANIRENSPMCRMLGRRETPPVAARAPRRTCDQTSECVLAGMGAVGNHYGYFECLSVVLRPRDELWRCLPIWSWSTCGVSP
jgi:hypothetical protein